MLDDVDECDLLAAHPADPQRVSDGVADGAIVPRLAIRACQAAMQAKADEVRFVYQLGRAYAATEKKTDALRHFERARQADYPAAIAAQADLQLDVLSAMAQELMKPAPMSEAVKAGHQALAQAVREHERAAKAGFISSGQRARALSFNPALFTHPVLGQIATGDFVAATASANQPETRAYIYTFVTNLIGQCGPEALSSQAVALLAAFRFGGGVSAADEETTQVGVQPLIGEIDAQRFSRRHGCEENGMLGLFFVAMGGFLEQAAARQ